VLHKKSALFAFLWQKPKTLTFTRFWFQRVFGLKIGVQLLGRLSGAILHQWSYAVRPYKRQEAF